MRNLALSKKSQACSLFQNGNKQWEIGKKNVMDEIKDTNHLSLSCHVISYVPGQFNLHKWTVTTVIFQLQ